MMELEACACIILSHAQSCLMAEMYIVLCTDLLSLSLLSEATLLLVQLLGTLLELLLAGRLAKVVGDNRARVGLVVLESGSAATGGLGVNVVGWVRRCIRVARLLCDLVGDAYSRVSYAFVICELLIVSLLPVASSSLGWTGMLMDLIGVLDVDKMWFGCIRMMSVECCFDVLRVPRASSPHALIKAAQPTTPYINPTMGS